MHRPDNAGRASNPGVGPLRAGTSRIAGDPAPARGMAVVAMRPVTVLGSRALRASMPTSWTSRTIGRLFLGCDISLDPDVTLGSISIPTHQLT